jgi:hypothetical protein
MNSPRYQTAPHEMGLMFRVTYNVMSSVSEESPFSIAETLRFAQSLP